MIDSMDYMVGSLVKVRGREWVVLPASSEDLLRPLGGQLPAFEREQRVARLGTFPRRLLVATDCLSEGVNLQDHFNAVVHYDLSWNPTRHEQREGRVDRYGQPSPTVRTLTYYGVDNQIDGIVLEVLLRKHRTIRSSLGISVAVPASTQEVVQALMQGVMLRGEKILGGGQLNFLDVDCAPAGGRVGAQDHRQPLHAATAGRMSARQRTGAGGGSEAGQGPPGQRTACPVWPDVASLSRLLCLSRYACKIMAWELPGVIKLEWRKAGAGRAGGAPASLIASRKGNPEHIF